MININDLKQRVHDIANKDQTGASIKPDLFNRLVNPAMLYVIRRFVGLPEEYRPDVPITAISYEKTQAISNTLSEIKVTDYMLPVSFGESIIPANYYYPIVLQYKNISKDSDTKYSKYKKIEPCDTPDTVQINRTVEANNAALKEQMLITPVPIKSTKEFVYQISNSIRKPTLDYPICSFNYPKISVAPNTIKAIYFTYLRKPAKAIWGYTVNQQTLEAVYNPLTSTNLELPYDMMDMVAAKILDDLGYRYRETELYQIADKIIKTGA